jgi:predicted Zn-dependent protease
MLEQRTACRDVGYLCAELASLDRVRLRRWKDFSGTVVVYVPRPDFESSGDAARLQEAAARGLRAWNGQPFQILTDLRGDRNPMFAVRWSRTLSGNQIGVARTQWSPQTGLRVVAIELSTRNPYDPNRLNDARQVQLTAAHEMGHALGVPHSGSERDVMYPSNTATSLSAQDYRSMEALYDFEDGTEIVRQGA